MRYTASAEEDNLSPFDSNNVCLCQSIEINNNKHLYRQSQVRKPTGSGVWSGLNARWPYGADEFKFLAGSSNSSVGFSAGIRAAGDLVSETMGSNPAFSRGRQRVSFWLKYLLPVPKHRR